MCGGGEQVGPMALRGPAHAGRSKRVCVCRGLAWGRAHRGKGPLAGPGNGHCAAQSKLGQGPFDTLLARGVGRGGGGGGCVFSGA